MADALASFIGGLKTLDPNNLGAPANAEALAKFQSLDNGTQREVLNNLTGKFGTSFDELNGLNDTDKRRVMDNMKNGRGTFDGVNRQTQKQPKSFNQQWADATQKTNANPNLQVMADTQRDFARRHGEEAARTRHGYVSPERERQLARIAEMQSQAKREGKTFADVADARMRAGQ